MCCLRAHSANDIIVELQTPPFSQLPQVIAEDISPIGKSLAEGRGAE